jgi:hypothetical protein
MILSPLQESLRDEFGETTLVNKFFADTSSRTITKTTGKKDSAGGRTANLYASTWQIHDFAPRLAAGLPFRYAKIHS